MAPVSRNDSRTGMRFLHLSRKRARAQSGACAEVQFPDYGTVFWSPGRRNVSRKALRFQHLICLESERSVWRMRRGEVT
jgi:hypothetical protein